LSFLITATSVTDSDRFNRLATDIQDLAGSCFLKTDVLFAKLQHFARMISPANHIILRAADDHNKRQ
jgi:hypothetical protein